MSENISVNWGVDLAKIIKDVGNENQYSSIGVNLGTVVSRSPLGVSILDGKVLIYADIHDIYVTHELNRKEIKNGDLVLVLADNDNQTFFLVDKITKQ